LLTIIIERKPTEENTPAQPINGLQTGPDLRFTSQDSFTSLPENDFNVRTVASFRSHQYNLKLSITKALMEIIDDQKREQIKKSTRQTEIVPILEGITLEERVEGLEIKESDLCERALKHLSGKLEDEKQCDDFMTFAAQYARMLEDEIYKLQGTDDMEQNGSLIYNSSPHGGDMMNDASDSPKLYSSKAGGKKSQSSFKLLKDWPKSNKEIPPINNDTERSKERNLNERFLLSPSVTRTMTLRSALTLNDKQKELFSHYLQQSPNMKPAEKTPQKSKLKPKPEEVYKDLLPFANKENLPPHIMVRTAATKRRWVGAPNEIANNNPERMFIYNEEFTILAVDDSAFTFKGLEALPCKYHKKFDFARNGTEAVKKYLSNINQGILYHFILLDLVMPVMDGFETARNIRAEEANKNFPKTYICAMSAFDDPDVLARTKKEGMDNFCQKPLRAEVLNNLIMRRSEEIGIKLPE